MSVPSAAHGLGLVVIVRWVRFSSALPPRLLCVLDGVLPPLSLDDSERSLLALVPIRSLLRTGS